MNLKCQLVNKGMEEVSGILTPIEILSFKGSLNTEIKIYNDNEDKEYIVGKWYMIDISLGEETSILSNEVKI